MANRLTRAVRPLIAVAALAGTAIAVPSLAQAAPHTTPRSDPSITEVRKHLGDLAVQNSQLVEQYNQAQTAVQERNRAAVSAAATATAAARTYEVRRTQFVQLIQAQYEGSTVGGSTSALLDSDSGTNYLDRLAALDLVSSNTAQVVREVHQARVDAVAASTRATGLLAAAKAQRAALGKKKTDVTDQIDRFRTLLDTLSAEQRAAFAAANAHTAPKADTTPKKLAQLASASGSKSSGSKVSAGSGGSTSAQAAVRFALAQVGKPYVFGADGPGSYDCSGLTMRAWQHGGVSLPHNAAGQYNYGHHVDRGDLQPGDLIFLYQPIGHVEIYIGNGMAVSAPTEGEPVQVVTVSHNSGDYTGATRLG